MSASLPRLPLHKPRPEPKAGSRLMEMFQKLDKNGDGKLSREEGRSLTELRRDGCGQGRHPDAPGDRHVLRPEGRIAYPPELSFAGGDRERQDAAVPVAGRFQAGGRAGRRSRRQLQRPGVSAGRRAHDVRGSAEPPHLGGRTRSEDGADTLEDRDRTSWSARTGRPSNTRRTGRNGAWTNKGAAVVFTVLDKAGRAAGGDDPPGREGRGPTQILTSGVQRSFSPFGTLWAEDASTWLAFAPRRTRVCGLLRPAVRCGTTGKDLRPAVLLGGQFRAALAARHHTHHLPASGEAIRDQVEIAELRHRHREGTVAHRRWRAARTRCGASSPRNTTARCSTPPSSTTSEIAIYRDLKDRGGLLDEDRHAHAAGKIAAPIHALDGAAGEPARRGRRFVFHRARRADAARPTPAPTRPSGCSASAKTRSNASCAAWTMAA